MKHALAALVLLLPLAGCSDEEDDQKLTVLAAASLTETFTELAEEFEKDHPGLEVELVFGSSTALAEQALDGAPGQVLATADERSIQLAEHALADSPDAFASNRLTLVTPPDNPAGIESLSDLSSPDVEFVVCTPTAPCGAIAAELLDSVGVSAEPASEEVDVKAVLARVSQGEADAGLVYRTDAVAAGDDVATVEVPDAAAFSTNYFVAPLHGDDARLADLAAEFVTMVRSNESRELLMDAGFGSVVRR